MKTETAEFIACGQRVALRSLKEADIPLLERWLPEALATAQGRKAPMPDDESEADRLLRQKIPGVLAIVEPGSDVPMGLIVYEASNGWVKIAFLAMEPGKRRCGLGGEVVLAFEDAAKLFGWGDRFRAPVHTDNGLGVYFWLRVGYRPASVSELADTTLYGAHLWMVRDG